jgi:hypothetical protein
MKIGSAKLLLLLVITLLISVTPALSSAKRAGKVSGTVMDSKGKPLAGVVISLIREGAEQVTKETRTSVDGTFLARVAPGTYALRAIAQGFETVFFPTVQVTASADLVYRFNLEPAGSGRTYPEKRADRGDPKWRLRSAQNRRSIFHISDQDLKDEVLSELAEERKLPRPTGMVESFVASTGSSNYAGTNFAISQPVSEHFDLLLAGQTGLGTGATQRLEALATVRLGKSHQLNLSAGGLQLDHLKDFNEQTLGGLGQISLKAYDQWRIKEGVIIVLGLDYSRFTGVNAASDFSPRFGFQLDANSRTRVRASYSPGEESEGVQSVARFEHNTIVFREPSRRTAFSNGRAFTNRNQRLELGVERLLGESSSIEAAAFADTSNTRATGLFLAPVSTLTTDASESALHGDGSRGFRFVFTRRISTAFKASLGYSFGRAQEITKAEILTPMFSDEFFQSLATQLDASFSSGTRVSTVLRFSPSATVFAIDPFAGRLAVYDPSLSILLAQELPTFGLPLKVEAIVDARNIMDVQSTSEENERMLLVGTPGRSVRGGISVKF